jgi:hypothetical protein
MIGCLSFQLVLLGGQLVLCVWAIRQLRKVRALQRVSRDHVLEMGRQVQEQEQQLAELRATAAVWRLAVWWQITALGWWPGLEK